jgi:hypothetical protein
MSKEIRFYCLFWYSRAIFIFYHKHASFWVIYLIYLCNPSSLSLSLSLSPFFITGKILAAGNEYDDEDKPSKPNGGMPKHQTEREFLPPPPPRKNHLDAREKQGPAVARAEEDDIFVGDGVDYAIPVKDLSQSPLSEDMEESPRNKEKPSYFTEPAYGPVQTSGLPEEWQGTVSLS